MAGKKKKGKGKKKKGAKKAAPAKLILPNFVPVHRTKMPLAIHVHHLDDMFLIYSDEYDESQKIIDELSKILNVEPTDLRLYFSNKRRVELDTVNHDQQIVHNVHLYLVMKKEEQWENIKDIIRYNIYLILIIFFSMPSKVSISSFFFLSFFFLFLFLFFNFSFFFFFF